MDIKGLINKIYEYLIIEYNSIKNNNPSKVEISDYNKIASYFDRLKTMKNEVEVLELYDEIKKQYESEKKNKNLYEKLGKIIFIFDSFTTKKEQKKTEFKQTYLQNTNCVIYLSISKEVRSRTEDYYSINPSKPDALMKRKKMFEALMARRNFLISIFENVPEKLNSVLQELGFIEAMERKAYDIKKENKKTKTLSKEQYLSTLKDVLTKFNKAYFNKDRNKILSIKEEYDSLFNVLFSKASDKKKYKELSKDIINLLTAYNLDGGYDLFKSYYSNGKIGNRLITKDLYEKGVENIKNKITQLINDASKLLGNDENKIIIIEYNNESLKEEISNINERDYNLCENIIQIGLKSIKER